MDDLSQEDSYLGIIERLYRDVGEGASPIPRDRTGSLPFRRGVPEALVHLSRNNRSELERQVRQAEEAQRQVLSGLAH